MHNGRMKVAIIGSSGHAKVIIDIFERSGVVIAGLIDGNRARGEMTSGYAVLGDDADIPGLISSGAATHVFIAIGDNALRWKVACRIGGAASFATAIHPSAQIGKNSSISAGTAVMAGAIIGPDTVIGEHCIVNTSASIDHDCRMERFSSLAPGSHVGGGCNIGEFAAIGIGACVRHRVTIGADAVVGAGAVVMRDIPSLVVAYGVPARQIRNRKRGDKYL